MPTNQIADIDIFTLFLSFLILFLIGFDYSFNGDQDSDLPWFIKREQAIGSDTRETGSSAIFRNRITAKTYLKTCPNVHVKTVYELLCNALKLYPSSITLGEINRNQKLNWIKYSELGNRIDRFGMGLLNSVPHLEATGNSFPSPTSLVGIYLLNCPEWVIADYACASLNLVSVVIHESFGLETIKDILSTTELSCLITCSSLCEKVAIESL